MLSTSLQRCRQLLRMTALRQAVVMTLAFWLVLLVAALISRWYLQGEIREDIDSELKLRHQALLLQLQQQADTPMPSSSLLFASWQPQQGVAKGPQHRRLNRLKGYANIELKELDHDWDDEWRAFGKSTPAGHLVVAINIDHRFEILEKISQSYLLISLLVGGVSLGLGVVIGLFNQRRYSHINRVLQQLAEGNLTARIALPACRDDLDRVALQIDRTSERLALLLRQTRDLTANISHDLKTPLARLRARLEAALLQPEQQDYPQTLGLALEQIDSMIATFEAILRIAYLDSGEQRGRFESLSLQQITAETAQIYQAVVEDSGRELSVQLEGDSQVEGSRELLIQLLANLIENALRHTPEGTAISLRCAPGCLEVGDSGPGIAVSERERVLEPMYRCEKSRHTPGSGLGLSLVNSIAQLHRAELSLQDNQPGLKVTCRFK